MMVPEGLEQILVPDEVAQGSRILLPKDVVDAVFLVVMGEFSDEGPETLAFVRGYVRLRILRIEGVEGDPVGKEGNVRLLFLLLCANQPADGPVEAYVGGLRLDRVRLQPT